MSDITDQNPDVYWIVDGRKYGRKIDALLAAQKTTSTVEFNYYNNQFNAFNWIDEPIESFEELATQRAYQLRESNKYLRLWYSGGADSHTMLQAFLLNKIHVDEIVMVRTSPSNDFNDQILNRESNLRSLPYIRSIRNQIPKTKISVVDITANQYLDYYKNTEWFNEVLSYDFCDDPGLLLGSRYAIEKYTSLKMMPGTVELSAADKPKVIRKDGVYYAPIVDSSFQYTYWANVKEFFTTPEFPALHSKQSHELKHIIERWYPDGDVTHDIYNPTMIDEEFKKEWYHCCRHVLNYDIDYGKGWSLFGPKIQLRIQDAKKNNPELLDVFMRPLKELQPMISNHWKDGDSPVSGILANVYSLGK